MRSGFCTGSPRLILSTRFHAVDHLAPDGVIAVEERAVLEADEELRVRRIGIVGARRADDAPAEIRVGELGLEVGQVGAAGPGAGRVAALRHEAVDDAVERRAVIEAGARQLLHPRHVVRREVGPKADRHRAAVELHEQRVFGVVLLGRRRNPGKHQAGSDCNDQTAQHLIHPLCTRWDRRPGRRPWRYPT